jgi:hypothetical protein
MKKQFITEIARMQKLAGILKEEQESTIDIGLFKNIPYNINGEEISLSINTSDDFKKIENSLDTGDSDQYNDEEISFLNKEMDKLAQKMSDYLTKIGIENEVVDTQLGYGQDIDNLEIIVNKSDLSKIK